VRLRSARCRYALCADGSLGAAGVVAPPRAAAAALAASLSSLLEPARATAAVPVETPSLDSYDTLVYLTAQAGFAGVRQDERALHALLAAAPAGGDAALSTPYCALLPPAERALAATPAARLRLLTAAPEAHGFAGAAGAAALVPAAYAVCEHRLLARLLARRGAAAVALREYARPGWQFHAKGLWLSPCGSDDDAACADVATAALGAPPVATLLGSSNYGARSTRRDVEAQVAVVTRHGALRGALAAEWRALAEHAPPAALPQLAARARSVPARLAATAARRWM
jgi:CDP-diacylglycerol--glycerol-3-phosphate 3-phosphatidyltransferase